MKIANFSLRPHGRGTLPQKAELIWPRQKRQQAIKTGISSACPGILRLALFIWARIADTYLILRDQDGAMLLLDQHAVHECILHERFLEDGLFRPRDKNSGPAGEIRLEPSEMQRFREISQILPRFGYDLSLFGKHFAGQSHSTLAFPAMKQGEFLHGGAGKPAKTT